MAHNNEMQGTPQAYLSCSMSEWPAASMGVKRRSTGAPDLNAVLRTNATENLTDSQTEKGDM